MGNIKALALTVLKVILRFKFQAELQNTEWHTRQKQFAPDFQSREHKKKTKSNRNEKFFYIATTYNCSLKDKTNSTYLTKYFAHRHRLPVSGWHMGWWHSDTGAYQVDHTGQHTGSSSSLLQPCSTLPLSLGSYQQTQQSYWRQDMSDCQLLLWSVKMKTKKCAIWQTSMQWNLSNLSCTGWDILCLNYNQSQVRSKICQLRNFSCLWHLCGSFNMYQKVLNLL